MPTGTVAEALRRVAPSQSSHPSFWELRLSAQAPLIQRAMFPCRDLQLNFPGAGISFEGYRFLRQTEALFRVDARCDVLQREGWVVEQGFRLHERAQISHETWKHRPGVRRLVADSLLTRPTRVLDSAISLRTRGDSNYFHTVNDILGSRVRLVEEAGVDPSVPVIVSPGLASQHFFSAIRQSPVIARREVVVQSGGRLRCAQLFYGQSATLNIGNILYARDALGVHDSDSSTGRRLYVARRPPAPRALANSAAVEDLLRRYGFTLVDPSLMPLEEQHELFSTARVVVGAHGAGLLNIMFRRSAPLHLIEILESVTGRPPPPHYMVLAEGLGFGYTPLRGIASGDNTDRGLLVDTEDLRRALEQVLSEMP